MLTVDPTLQAYRTDRLGGVESLAFHGVARAKLREALKPVHDLERLVGRAGVA